VKARLARSADAAFIAGIYGPFVTDSAVSLEDSAPDEGEIARRMASGAGLYPWLIACDSDGTPLGYAMASAFRPRHGYRFTVETSIYLATSRQGLGLGRTLYSALLETLEAQGFGQAIAAVTLPNPPSAALHERLGFRPIGEYRDVGYKFGAWRSVGLWQRGLAALSNDPEPPRPVDEVWRDVEL